MPVAAIAPSQSEARSDGTRGATPSLANAVTLRARVPARFQSAAQQCGASIVATAPMPVASVAPIPPQAVSSCGTTVASSDIPRDDTLTLSSWASSRFQLAAQACGICIAATTTPSFVVAVAPTSPCAIGGGVLYNAPSAGAASAPAFATLGQTATGGGDHAAAAGSASGSSTGAESGAGTAAHIPSSAGAHGPGDVCDVSLRADDGKPKRRGITPVAMLAAHPAGTLQGSGVNIKCCRNTFTRTIPVGPDHFISTYFAPCSVATRPMVVIFKIKHVPLVGYVDTGANVSLLSERAAALCNLDVQECDDVITTAGGGSTPVVGVAKATATVNAFVDGKPRTLAVDREFAVMPAVPGGFDALLDAAWFTEEGAGHLMAAQVVGGAEVTYADLPHGIAIAGEAPRRSARARTSAGCAWWMPP